MMKTLSFDCGHESLGIGMIEFFPDELRNINELLTKDFMNAIYAIDESDRLSYDDMNALVSYIMITLHKIMKHIRGLIKIHFLASAQLLSDIRKSGMIERASVIRSFLESINEIPDVVLIEDQTINNISSEVSAQVAFFYSKKTHDCCIFPRSQIEKFIKCENTVDGPNIIIMNPKKKNKIKFATDLGIEHFYGKYVSLYEANKNHTKANFLYWMDTIKPPGWEEYTCTYKKKTSTGIPAKRKRDISDAFMQAVAYFLNEINGFY